MLHPKGADGNLHMRAIAHLSYRGTLCPTWWARRAESSSTHGFGPCCKEECRAWMLGTTDLTEGTTKSGGFSPWIAFMPHIVRMQLFVGCMANLGK